MTIGGRLLSSTATVMFLERKKIKVHPSDRLPFPLEFRNHNVVLETVVKVRGPGAAHPAAI